MAASRAEAEMPADISLEDSIRREIPTIGSYDRNMWWAD